MRRMCLFISFILTLMLLSGVVLSSSSVSADDSAVVQATITVPVACTMQGTGTNTHNATLNPGTYSGASGSDYQNGIGKTTLTAICNDDNGFSIYAIGYTGNSYDSANHTKLVGSSTNETISTKAYASGDTASNWSMKLTKVTNTSQSYNPQNLTLTTGYDSWHAIPDTYTKVAQYKANTGSSATDTTLGVKLETTYAAFIASTQPADTYTGQVKYTMVHPYNNEPHDGPIANCPAGRICYSPNANDTEGTMGQQTIPTSGTIDGVSPTSATLLASNFSRIGYGFAGWSDKFDYATNPEAKFYGPQETISFTAGQYTGTNPGLSLYAVWIKSQGSLQDASKVATVCNGLTQAPTNGTANLLSVSALTDRRDNETYAIAKLADGKCWMIENMRLENTGTDNTNGSLAQGYNASFVGLADPEAPWTNNSTAANSLYSTDGSTVKTISGSSQGYRFPRYNNVNTPTNATDRPNNPTSNSATNSTSNASMYSYGNYYTWHAAIADTTHYSTNNQSVASTSICPSGWHLPKGGDETNEANNEFWALVVTGINGGVKPANYGYYTGTAEAGPVSNALRAYPNNFVYSSGIYGDSVTDRGSYSYYWSSTAGSISDTSYFLYFYGSYVNPGSHYVFTYYGWAVRCVASGV